MSDLIFQYVDLLMGSLSASSWPIAIVIVAYIFRTHLNELFPRIQKVGPQGIEFAAQVKKQAKLQKSSSDITELASLPDRERTPAIVEVEQRVRASLQERPEESRLDDAIYDLAISKLDQHFWFVYGRILGEQIKLLRFLKERGMFLTYEETEAYVSALKENDPIFADWETDIFIEFLRRNFLVSDVDGGIALSEVGNDFLLFLHRMSLSDKDYRRV